MLELLPAKDGSNSKNRSTNSMTENETSIVKYLQQEVKELKELIRVLEAQVKGESPPPPVKNGEKVYDSEMVNTKSETSEDRDDDEDEEDVAD